MAVQDRAEARLVLSGIRERFRSSCRVWVDGGHGLHEPLLCVGRSEHWFSPWAVRRPTEPPCGPPVSDIEKLYVVMVEIYSGR